MKADKFTLILTTLFSASLLYCQEADPPADLLAPLDRPEKPAPSFSSEGFSLRPGEEATIVLFGGANAAECNRNGWLETRLITAFPESRIRLRNLAWPTDTISKQWRPRNFFSASDPEYGEKDGRPAISADIVFLWFGQMESLEGAAKLSDFRAAYESLVSRLKSNYTGRIVLITPVPFSDPLKLGFDLKKRAADLKLYADAIRNLGKTHGLPIVDLANSEIAPATSDGALLSESGHEAAALSLAQSLGLSESLPPNADYIRQTVREKNAVWIQYWMPTNWAFLYGNRQTQPSSRDHTDPKKRWFPEEIKAMREKVRNIEDDLHAAAGG